MRGECERGERRVEREGTKMEWLSGGPLLGVGTTIGFFSALIIGYHIRLLRERKAASGEERGAINDK